MPDYVSLLAMGKIINGKLDAFRQFKYGVEMVQGILIALIAIFAFIFIRGLRSGSSFIYNRYMDPGGKLQGPRGSVGLARKEYKKKRRGYGAPLSLELKDLPYILK